MRIKYIFAIVLLVIFLPVSVWATIFIGTETQSFHPDTVFDDDIFLVGNMIRFQSQVNGDLIGANQEFVFSGMCLHNINWAARTIIINGQVNGSFRGCAQKIDINAPIGRNIIAFGQEIIIGPATSISRDATLMGETIIFEGSVGNKLSIEGDRVTIAGRINGDLEIAAKEIDIEPSTMIEGDLIYKSPDKIKIEESVTINGETRWTQTEIEQIQKKYSAFSPIKFLLAMYLVINFIVGFIVFLITLLLGNTTMIPLMFLALIVSGIILVKLNKKFTLKTTTTIEQRFLASLGMGILLILLFPFAAFLSILTIIGIPIGLIIVFAFGIFCFTGTIYTAQFTGNYIGRLLKIKRTPPCVLCLVLGIIFLTSLILIPFIGWIIALVILASGLGASVISLERVKVDIDNSDRSVQISSSDSPD